MNAAQQRKDLILVVDDSPDSLGMIHHALDQAGLTALVALEGQQALGIAEKMTPDLILMDIQLPEVSGLEVTAWLKAEDDLKHIPVIAVTAFAMRGDEKKIREGGCEDYLSKPISVTSFIETVEKHLNKGAAAS